MLSHLRPKLTWPLLSIRNRDKIKLLYSDCSYKTYKLLLVARRHVKSQTEQDYKQTLRKNKNKNASVYCLIS